MTSTYGFKTPNPLTHCLSTQIINDQRRSMLYSTVKQTSAVYSCSPGFNHGHNKMALFLVLAILWGAIDRAAFIFLLRPVALFVFDSSPTALHHWRPSHAGRSLGDKSFLLFCRFPDTVLANTHFYTFLVVNHFVYKQYHFILFVSIYTLMPETVAT